jgi:glutamate-1-semialdehyde 2,1-aminomutase
MNTKESEELFAKSRELMPGGVNSPVRAFGQVKRSPVFMKRAKGDKIFDEDGNSYIDYVCSWGPGILGHAHEKVIEAVKAACDDGLTFGAPTRKELEMAQLINQLMPSMEMSRMVNSGTEAVMSALRAARGFTGRDNIVKFRGCYHGHSDGLLVKAGSAALTGQVPDSLGVPAGYAKHTLLADYNNEESVKQLFEMEGDNIAAVVVEPVAANMGVVPPKPGFLQFLRDITQKYGSLLIMDEVITGFRLSLGGAQEYYGVTPDLTTLGKIVGGGMPVGAYGGRKEVMSMVAPVGGVYQAGTLSGNPIAMTAGLETLRILEKKKDTLYDEIERKTAKIAKTVKNIFGDNVTVNQVGSLMSVFFTDREVFDLESAKTSDTEKYSAYFSQMLDKGIYLAPSQFEAMFVSAAHSDEDIDKTCEAIASCKL